MEPQTPQRPLPGSPPPETPGGGTAAGDAPQPDLAETLRNLRDSGRSGIGAAGDVARSLRDLLAADVSLARSAAGRSAVFGGIAMMFAVTAWLLLMTALIVVLSNQLGLPWWMSLSGCGLLSLLGAWLAMRKAMEYFEHTRLKATRRQLARLGIGELSDLMPPPGTAASARKVEPAVGEQARNEGKTPP